MGNGQYIYLYLIFNYLIIQNKWAMGNGQCIYLYFIFYILLFYYYIYGQWAMGIFKILNIIIIIIIIIIYVYIFVLTIYLHNIKYEI